MKYETVITGLLANLQRELALWQAALLEAPPETLNRPAHGPGRPDPVWGIAGRRQQMQLALMQQLTTLMQQLHAGAADTTLLLEQVAAAHRALTALGQLGQGWFDERPVRRTVMVDDQPQRREFGPYVYYRWSEGGRVRSLYLGHRDGWRDWPTKLANIGITITLEALATILGMVRPGNTEHQDAIYAP